MDTIIKTQIIDLIHREVIPAIGCTERFFQIPFS